MALPADQVDVMLVTCRDLPEPDVDEGLLVGLLEERGLRVRVAAWDDPNVSWRAARLAVVRSTWDYHQHVDAFAAWIDHAAEETMLLNPAAVLRRNLRKRYLLDLEHAGIAITPTLLVEAVESRPSRDIVRSLSCERVVVKPEVSGGSWRTLVADVDRAATHLDALRADDIPALVQPFLSSVETTGERCIVFVDGEACHAVRKQPRWYGDEESVSDTPVAIAEDEGRFARRVLEAADAEQLLYARVDLARDDAGAPVLMELELVEPSLFLTQSMATAHRFADAIASRCA